jgi:hypothetical protein
MELSPDDKELRSILFLEAEKENKIPNYELIEKLPLNL